MSNNMKNEKRSLVEIIKSLKMAEIRKNVLGLKLALEQLDGEIETKVENSVKVIKSIEGDILALKEEEKRLAGRRKALENKVSSMKEYIEHNLNFIEDKKVKTTLFTVAMQNNKKSVNILNEEVIPEEYVKTVTTTSIDKVALYEAMEKQGLKIDGVELVQTQSLRIR